jgi:hypothetical protein
MAAKLKKVDPADRDQFAQIVGKLATRAAQQPTAEAAPRTQNLSNRRPGESTPRR